MILYFNILYRPLADYFSDFRGISYNTISPMSLSPPAILLQPPKKLVIEVKVIGRYSRIIWHRNGTTIPQSSLSNFNELYVVEETSTSDFGYYQVIPATSPPGVQIVQPSLLNFVVTSPGNLSCSRNSNIARLSYNQIFFYIFVMLHNNYYYS